MCSSFVLSFTMTKLDGVSLEKVHVSDLGITMGGAKPGAKRLIDKVTVFRKLLEIFQTGDADKDTYLKKILRNNVINYPFYFGTPCDLYDIEINHMEYQVGTDEVDHVDNGKETWVLFYDKDLDDGGRQSISGDFHCQDENHLEVPFNPSSNVVRSGLMLKTCGDILFPEWSDADEEQSVDSLSENNYLTSVLQKVCGSDSCSWDENNIKNSIHLFYPYLKKYVPLSEKIKPSATSKVVAKSEFKKSLGPKVSIEVKAGVVSSTIPEAVIDTLKKEFMTYTSDDHKFRFLFYTMCAEPNWH